MPPLSWPSAIAHIDCDSFFASCEISLNPHLAGKPIAVIGGGAQKGVVTSASYEARPFGLKAGMPVFQARKACPQCIFIEGHFEHYGMLSRKVFDTLRDISPFVEEASVDEGYVDIAGLRRLYKSSYGEIGSMMQSRILNEVRIPVSVGIAPTKTLAKIASDFRKPRGLVVVSYKQVRDFLAEVPIRDVPGIGMNSQALLDKYMIRTGLDFITRDTGWAKQLFGKRGTEMHAELSGNTVYPVSILTQPHKSLSRSRTLERPTSDLSILESYLLSNVSLLTSRLRRYGMSARSIGIFLRDQQFRTSETHVRLPQYMRIDEELFPYVQALFRQCYRPGTLYRLTGVVLDDLTVHTAIQPSLFDDVGKLTKQHNVSRATDHLNAKFGRGTITRAATRIHTDPLILCSFKKGSDIHNQEL